MSSGPADSPGLPADFTCGLDAALRLTGAKWKLLILYFLAQDGLTRYVELRRAVRDVSDTVMSQKLKELEAETLVERIEYPDAPARVDYRLTPLGRSLVDALRPLSAWGVANAPDISRLLARRDGAIT